MTDEAARRKGHNEERGPRHPWRVPSAPASVKALRPLCGAQNRAALTDAAAPGETLTGEECLLLMRPKTHARATAVGP
jgi:hypothetical protein